MASGNKNLSAIILAAGLGKRMKSEIPKVLHQVCFKPILYYILKSVSALNLKNIFVVVGHKEELVRQFLSSEFPGCHCSSAGKPAWHSSMLLER